MTTTMPATELQPQFSDPQARATAWEEACDQLARAEIYWLSTVRPEGRPHVTPLMAVWLDESLFFCTGADERKAKNLAGNAACVLTTGCNTMNEGLDLVVEGEAVVLREEHQLQRVAAAYLTKYGWRYIVGDGAFHGDDGNVAQVYKVAPQTAFGFGKGTFSQTRWRF